MSQCEIKWLEINHSWWNGLIPRTFTRKFFAIILREYGKHIINEFWDWYSYHPNTLSDVKQIPKKQLIEEFLTKTNA